MTLSVISLLRDFVSELFNSVYHFKISVCQLFIVTLLLTKVLK